MEAVQKSGSRGNVDDLGCSKDPYLVVDYGEKLLHHVDDTRRELQNEIVSLREKVQLLWEFVRVFSCSITLLLLALCVALFSRQFLPQCIVPVMTTIAFSSTVGFAFLNIAPMQKALLDVIGHVQYEPRFTTCECKHCRAQGSPGASGTESRLAAQADLENID